MTVNLRAGTTADAAACGAICHAAFDAVCTRHGFAPDFPSADAASGLMSMLLGHPRFYSVVAEADGRIVGSNFLDERSAVFGVGPITVDPTAQNRGVGGRLMEDVIARAARQRAAGVRLLQAGFHNRSLCLYSTPGFRTREPVSILQGAPLAQKFSGLRGAPRRSIGSRCLQRDLPAGAWFRSRGRSARRDRREAGRRRRAAGPRHRIHDRHRVLCAYGRGNQHRPDGADRRRAGVRRARASCCRHATTRSSPGA